MIKECWSCGSESKFFGSNSSGFVECSNDKCGICGPSAVKAVAERKWNYMCDTIKEMEDIREKHKQGRGFFPITQRQRDVLYYVAEYIEEHGHGPLVREIGEHVSLQPSSVKKHLAALEDKGYIERIYNITRGLKVLRLPA